LKKAESGNLKASNAARKLFLYLRRCLAKAEVGAQKLLFSLFSPLKMLNHLASWPDTFVDSVESSKRAELFIKILVLRFFLLHEASSN
jgi:hypothetical protein